MEIVRLISMTDFVIEQRKNKDTDNIRRFWACERYAEFLMQPLKLEMFVPCDNEGNVLETTRKPLSPASDEDWDKWNEYTNAKVKVLFEGFEVCNRNSEMDCVVNKNFHLSTDFKHVKTVEHLISRSIIYLSPIAINRLK